MCNKSSNTGNVVPLWIGIDPAETMKAEDIAALAKKPFTVTHIDQSTNRITHVDESLPLPHPNSPRREGKTTVMDIKRLVMASDGVQYIIDQGFFFDKSPESVAQIVEALNSLESATAALKAKGY